MKLVGLCAVADAHRLFSLAKIDRVPQAELKNGKVIFRQKPVSFEKMSDTMQGGYPIALIFILYISCSSEIVNFRDMVEDRVSKGCPTLEKIPDAHLPLIAKLIHER